MLLSIAIPSHNKTYFLNQALNSIIKEEGIGTNFDVVISDNSPNNDIKNLYKDKFKFNTNINWFDSKDFSCLDSNVNRSVELCKGEYVWIFGDDDLVVSNTLPSIISFLEENKPNLLILNSQSFINSTIIEDSRMPNLTEKFYDKTQNDEFLEELGGYLTYIGSIIVKRSLWLKYYDHSKIGTFFSHLQCIANIKDGRSAHFFSQPAIKMRIGSQTWSSKSFLIWHKFYPDIIWGLKNFSNQSKGKVVLKNPSISIKSLLASKAYKRYSFTIWREVLLKSNQLNFLNKFYALIISLISSKMLSITYKYYILFFRNKHTNSFSPKLALAKLQYQK